MQQSTKTAALSAARPKKQGRFIKDMKKNGGLYLLASGVILFYVLFYYKPMYGILIAFKNMASRFGACKMCDKIKAKLRKKI